MNREIRESPFIWRDEPITLEARQEWLDQHRRSNQPVIVACDGDGVVIGWGSLSTFRPASGYRFTCEISVYVAREAHRRGIGRRLVDALHHSARAMGLHTLIACIDADHAGSIRLFESFGYVSSGRLDGLGFKFGAWRGEVFMVKQL